MNAERGQAGPAPKGWGEIEGDEGGAVVVTLPDPIDEFLAGQMDIGELRMSDEAIAVLDAGPDPLMRDEVVEHADGSFTLRMIPRVDEHLESIALAMDGKKNFTENERRVLMDAYANQLRMIAADLRRMFPHAARVVDE